MFYSTSEFNQKQLRIEFIFSFKIANSLTSLSYFQTMVQLVFTMLPISNILCGISFFNKIRSED